MSGMWLVSYIILWVLLLVIAFTLLNILHNLGVIYNIIHPSADKQGYMQPTKIQPGTVLPEVELYTLGAIKQSTTDFIGKRLAISIISPHCEPCQQLLKRIATEQDNFDPIDPTVTNAAIISMGSPEETAQLIKDAGLPASIPVLVDANSNISKTWGIKMTPTTVVVNEKLSVVRFIVGVNGQTV
jgi:hypothetical protein